MSGDYLENMYPRAKATHEGEFFIKLKGLLSEYGCSVSAEREVIRFNFQSGKEIVADKHLIKAAINPNDNKTLAADFIAADMHVIHQNYEDQAYDENGPGFIPGNR